MKKDLLKALATTYYLVTGKNPDSVLKTALIDELDQYPPKDVLHALNRCKRECKGFLPLAEIIERMPKRQMSANEAWAKIPTEEWQSVLWTEAMREAYGACYEQLKGGDKVAARMAFIEAYRRYEANNPNGDPKVQFSAGTDKQHRIAVLKEAYDRKLITGGYAIKHLPYDVCTDQQIAHFEGKQLEAGESALSLNYELKLLLSGAIKSLDEEI